MRVSGAVVSELGAAVLRFLNSQPLISKPAPEAFNRSPANYFNLLLTTRRSPGRLHAAKQIRKAQTPERAFRLAALPPPVLLGTSPAHCLLRRFEGHRAAMVRRSTSSALPAVAALVALYYACHAFVGVAPASRTPTVTRFGGGESVPTGLVWPSPEAEEKLREAGEALVSTVAAVICNAWHLLL
eukprot:s5269_g1.t1